MTPDRATIVGDSIAHDLWEAYAYLRRGRFLACYAELLARVVTQEFQASILLAAMKRLVALDEETTVPSPQVH